MRKLYSQINISLAVYPKIEAGKAKGFYTDLSKIDWNNIYEIKDNLVVKYFLNLDAGEAEVIAMATELNADLIILD